MDSGRPGAAGGRHLQQCEVVSDTKEPGVPGSPWIYRAGDRLAKREGRRGEGPDEGRMALNVPDIRK